MKLKKLNAAVSLVTLVLLLLHIGYSVYAYLTFYYNPFMTKLLAIPMAAVVCLHAVLGMCAVFLQGDGARPDLYPGLNRATIIQRVSAALIFPLLILHINTFALLSMFSERSLWVPFALVLLAQVCFYAALITHVSVSLTRAFITLGWLTSMETKRKLDRVIYVIGAALFVVAAVSVIRTQLGMFLG